MAVDITIGGKKIITASSYEVVEDSSPISVADNSGGTSQITAVVGEYDNWKRSIQKGFSLSDSTQGTTTGRVTVPSKQGANITVTADSRLAQLSVKRTAGPFSGTLRNALLYYMSLCGITTGFVIDDRIASKQVIFPGWEGNVWDFVNKKMAPAHGVEISLVSNNIVMRPLRDRIAVNYRNSALSESFDVGDLARKVSVNYYNSRNITNQPVYPPDGWNEDVQVYQVEAGEELIIEDIEINASLTSVMQPSCVLFVGPYDNTRSVYTVAGKDGLPIPPQQWLDGGGSVKVEINPDTRSLKVTIVGASMKEYAPYKLAVASGESDYYSTLRLLGTGVAFKIETLELSTGYTEDEAPNEYGAEVDNECIRTLADAHSAGAWLLSAYGAPSHSISVTTSGINRLEDNGSFAYPTFGDFDAANPGQTQAQFNTQWNGKGQADFDKFWTEKVQLSFSNQAFGNIGGARVKHEGNWMRIRSATVRSGKQVQYRAEQDTVVQDLDDKGRGMTNTQFDAIWGVGTTFGDFNSEPLKGFE